MKNGSIVKCIKILPEYLALKDLGNKIPKLHNYYVVRDIVFLTGSYCLQLEEIQNKKSRYSEFGKPIYTECAFIIDGFHEIFNEEEIDLSDLLGELYLTVE